MIIKNEVGLIGDFLGTIPVMQYLSEKEYVKVKGLPIEVVSLFYSIKWSPDNELLKAKDANKPHDFEIDLTKAFNIASSKNLHMTQAHFAVLGLPIPEAPVRPILIETRNIKSNHDYVLSPFSRSLPEDQRWPQKNWQDLVDEMYDKNFLLIGSSKDDIDFISGTNVNKAFGAAWFYIMNVIKMCKGIISVVTGTSHLAYALEAKNYLFCNQGGPWGINPDARIIEKGKPIKEITVKEVKKYLEHDTTINNNTI